MVFKGMSENSQVQFLKVIIVIRCNPLKPLKENIIGGGYSLCLHAVTVKTLAQPEVQFEVARSSHSTYVITCKIIVLINFISYCQETRNIITE